MKAIKTFWRKLSSTQQIMIIVIVIAGLSFYWYEYRPNKIRKDCAVKSTSVKGNLFDPGSFANPPGTVGWERKYNACLKSKGLSN